jgi:hypothetical protein
MDTVRSWPARPAPPPETDVRAIASALHCALTASPEQVNRLRAAGTTLVAARDYTTCVTRVLAVLALWAIATTAANP